MSLNKIFLLFLVAGCTPNLPSDMSHYKDPDKDLYDYCTDDDTINCVNDWWICYDHCGEDLKRREPQFACFGYPSRYRYCDVFAGIGLDDMRLFATTLPKRPWQQWMPSVCDNLWNQLGYFTDPFSDLPDCWNLCQDHGPPIFNMNYKWCGQQSLFQSGKLYKKAE